MATSGELVASANTFYSKQWYKCPVCSFKFRREEMFTGRGRLIADDLTVELRRTYQTSSKYGSLFPLIYPITVCPDCLFGAYNQDFVETPKAAIGELQDGIHRRKETLASMFDTVDFKIVRDIRAGVASYVLAMMSYECFPIDASPTIKQAVSSLRGAWLGSDLHSDEVDAHWDLVSGALYRKARYLYSTAIEREHRGKEPINSDIYLGPDVDKNWGFDGAVYISSVLDYYYGSSEDIEARTRILINSKRMLSKIFGLGKASKAKPSVLLESVRGIYDKINAELPS